MAVRDRVERPGTHHLEHVDSLLCCSHLLALARGRRVGQSPVPGVAPDAPRPYQRADQSTPRRNGEPARPRARRPTELPPARRALDDDDRPVGQPSVVGQRRSTGMHLTLSVTYGGSRNTTSYGASGCGARPRCATSATRTATPGRPTAATFACSTRLAARSDSTSGHGSGAARGRLETHRTGPGVQVEEPDAGECPELGLQRGEQRLAGTV